MFWWLTVAIVAWCFACTTVRGNCPESLLRGGLLCFKFFTAAVWYFLDNVHHLFMTMLPCLDESSVSQFYMTCVVVTTCELTDCVLRHKFRLAHHFQGRHVCSLEFPQNVLVWIFCYVFADYFFITATLVSWGPVMPTCVWYLVESGNRLFVLCHHSWGQQIDHQFKEHDSKMISVSLSLHIFHVCVTCICDRFAITTVWNFGEST